MKLNRVISTLLVASMTLTSSTAFTQSVPSPDPEPEDVIAKIAPLKKGHVAPFAGVLFSPKATATVITEYETFDQRIKVEIDKVIKTETAKRQFEVNEANSKCITSKTLLQADIDAKASEIKRLNTDLINARKDADDAIANAPSRLLWTGIGVAAGAATAILLTFAVTQATK